MNQEYLEKEFASIRKALRNIQEEIGEEGTDNFIVNTYENIYDELVSLQVYIEELDNDRISKVLQEEPRCSNT